MTESEDRVGYWLNRLQSDGILLTETQRMQLVQAHLECLVGLNPDELSTFLDPQVFEDQDRSRLIDYTKAERKVADFYNCATTYTDPESIKEKRELFMPKFRETLKDIYSPGDIDEFSQFMPEGDEGMVVRMLVGIHHWTTRRIRNAYLPGITTVVSGGKDVTHLLFDGPGDAVDQIEKVIFGDTNPDLK